MSSTLLVQSHFGWGNKGTGEKQPTRQCAVVISMLHEHIRNPKIIGELKELHNNI